MATIDILYFSWVREAVGRDAETVDVPEAAATIADLLDHLAAQDADHAAAFAERDRLRAALDQRFVDLNATLGEARELAIFPPVTGG